MGSLKSFIKAVRKAKTIADERAVIRKESASIRTSFRDPALDQTTRRINISKLLYLYIMGEKTHFGQVECIKLLASPRFADKRLGYLATMLLLDENQEVLTLLTNSLDNDMQHPNSFIVGLALCCLGNIASPELARDLYGNVEKIITTNNIYLKKKACLVAGKLVEKDPDLAEMFIPKVNQLISDKQPAIILGTCRLIQSLYYSSEEHRQLLVSSIPKLVEHLKRLSSSGYVPEYDVMGIPDPFLQSSLLSTLRTLAMDESCSAESLEQVNDILTQVASNIEGGKNVAHAILYECVRTIFAIRSDQALKILGVNLLGKFLTNKDNNIRYVALESLLTVINIEPLAVQRHRATIVSCLSDGDISIRRRALELSFAILNDQNIRVLVREILQFLELTTDSDLKSYISSQLTIAANKYAPNDKWHFDTLIRMLKLSGSHVTQDILSSIMALIIQCNDSELKNHIVSRLYVSCVEDTNQYGLALVTIWCLGEYGDYILNHSVEISGKQVSVTEVTILKVIDDILNNSVYSEQEYKQLVIYVFTSVIKLSIKFQDPQNVEKIRLLINSKIYDNNLEIQIRAVEFQKLLTQPESLKRGLLAKMPAPPIKERESVALHSGKSKTSASNTNSQPGSQSNTENLLLDLMDDNEPESTPSVPVNNNDLLADLFGSTSQPTAQQPVTSDVKGLFNGSELSSSNNVEKLLAFSGPDFSIFFVPKVFDNGQSIIETVVESTSNKLVDHFQLLIAVPKSQKLTISSTSGGETLSQGSPIKQVLKVVGKAGSKVKLRVKVKYHTSENGDREEQFDFGGFSSTL